MKMMMDGKIKMFEQKINFKEFVKKTAKIAFNKLNSGAVLQLFIY